MQTVLLDLNIKLVLDASNSTINFSLSLFLQCPCTNSFITLVPPSTVGGQKKKQTIWANSSLALWHICDLVTFYHSVVEM